MECKHEWVHKEGAIKERCKLCNAARVYDPNRCPHQWVKAKGKERCLLCGAGRKTLEVHDVVMAHKPEEPGVG